MRRRAVGAVVATVLPILLLVPPRSAAAAGLTGTPGLALAYRLILDARFPEAGQALGQACPPAPVEACQVLRAAAVWWRILLDPESPAQDAAFSTTVDTAIAATEAWTAREPRRAEAWFYLGGAYAARAQWKVLRQERLAAARDGQRIKDALERALALDAGLQDAWFGIGLYHYYADVAPMAARVLRFLLWLPGGDRVAGLREMRQARDRGELVGDEADYQMHLLELWYEHDTGRALSLLEGLRARHPANPLFLQKAAEIEHVYRHDAPASLDLWRTLAAQARAGLVAEPALTLSRARLGVATMLDATFETDRAVEELQDLLAGHPAAPYAIAARAALVLGGALDRLGRRGEAEAAYRRALAAAPPDEAFGVGVRARAALRQAPDARAAEAYRASLEGGRALERGALDEAASRLARAQALVPADPLTLVRAARLAVAQHDAVRAVAIYERAIAAPIVAPIVRAFALVEAADLLDARGDRARAVALYRDATRVDGADPRTRDRAARAIARLALLPQLF